MLKNLWFTVLFLISHHALSEARTINLHKNTKHDG